MGGYYASSLRCQNATGYGTAPACGAQARMCTIMEVIRHVQRGGYNSTGRLAPSPLGGTPDVWVSAGYRLDTAWANSASRTDVYLENDCEGWTQSTDSVATSGRTDYYVGTTFSTGTPAKPWKSSCANSLQILCCDE